MADAEYNKHYARGWRSSEKTGGGGDALDRADSRGAHPAWYDGYYDHAAGRAKWHTREARTLNPDQFG